MERNHLVLDVEETKLIKFRSLKKHDKKSVTPKFDDTIIEEVKEQKFRGVWFHGELSWNTPLNNSKTALKTSWLYK